MTKQIGLQSSVAGMANMSAISRPSAFVLGSSPQKVVKNISEQFSTVKNAMRAKLREK